MARRNVLFRQHPNRSLAGNIAVFLCLLLFGVFFAFPVVFAINTAFKPLNEILVFPPRFFAVNPTRENFIQLSKVVAEFWVPLSRYIFNSVFISAVVTLGHLLLSSMAAYPMAHHNFPGSKTLNTVIVLSLLFTSTVTYIPQYVILANLRMINTYWAIILPAMQSSLGLYLMRSFMMGIPKEMLEAARIDGASEKRTYFSIVMPNVKPAALTLIIFSFQSIWNYVGGSAVYAEQLKGLPALLQSIAAAGVARSGVTAAATVLLMIPPVLIFILSQNNVIETMSTSGLK